VPARSLVAIGLLAAAFGGCAAQKDSSTKFTGPKRPVAQAIEDLQEAGQKGDAKKVCADLLASSVVKRVTTPTKTCTKVVKQQLDDADTFELTVVSVSLDGASSGAGSTHATARVKSTDNGKDRFDLFTLVKESGRWRIQSLGGV
jgi:hypothetical protein